ncbi:MAG: hypothetical protein IKK64_02145 [Bacteroidales bacterium]|nr:hypothetical protein [Bacteroidales bacterium]
MEKLSKEIPLLGISNSSVADICNDGECCDIVNMRNDCGVWNVCGKPEKVLDGNSEGRICKYIHCNNNYAHLISYDGSTVRWEANIVNNQSVKVGEIIAEIKNVSSFESVGNILILVCEGGNQFSVFGDNRYSHIGTIESPTLSFNLELSHVAKTIADPANLPHKHTESINKEKNYTFIAERFYKQVIAIKENNGTLNSPFLVRYALKLYDGSYIKPSAPILMMPTDDIRKGYTNTIKILKNENDKYSINYIGTNYKCYNLFFNAYEIPSAKWDNIISSVDIFISRPISVASENFDLVSYKNEHQGESEEEIFVDIEYPTLSDIEFREKINDETLFYKIASFKLEELRNSDTFKEKLYIPYKFENLPSQDSLPIDNYSHYDIFGNVSLLYNSRLHFGNVRRYLPKVFNLSNFIVSQNEFNKKISECSFSGAVSCHIKVSINDDSGIKYVEMDLPIHKEGYMSPYISYPDSRAYSMEIWIKYSDGTIRYKLFPLKSSKVENMAYYISSQFNGIELDEYNGDIPSLKQRDYDSFPNLLRVSNHENPFYFPQELSYSVSNGEILNISAVTAELSQGRYGEFPLYIFTSDGIWTLQQGSEEVVYQTLLPVSRDIAISNKGIASTDNAIVFLADKGLMLLSGSSVTQLSSFGLERSDIIAPIEVEGNEVTIKSDQTCVDNFKEYIKNSHIKFNYSNNELLFLNSGKEYLYSFSLNGTGWSRIEFTNTPLLLFLNIYPDLYVCDSTGSLYNLSREIMNESLPFIVTTRAIKGIDNFRFKQLKEVFIKGELDFIEDSVYVTILGSNLPDRDFLPIASYSLKNSFVDGVRIPVFSPAYKYFRVSVYGNGKSGMNINGIILMFTIKYGMKAR